VIDRSHGRIPGMRGAMLSQDALLDVVPDRLRGLLDEVGRARARRRLRAWHLPLRRVLGPASGARTILDTLATPLFAQLGYRMLPDGATSARSNVFTCALGAGGRTVAVLIVTGWGADANARWRDAVHLGIAYGVRWCFCVTGPSLRVVDCARTYSRKFVELDLEAALDDDRTFGVLWGLLRARALSGEESDDNRALLDRAIAISEDHRSVVRSSLQAGVDAALSHLHGAFFTAAAARRRIPADRAGQLAFDEALIVVYRILFLLFAEARGLVPRWHPIYRDGYSIEALRQPVETLPRPRGLWEAIQSIARLAHRGCRIGALRVTPFNGRLFSPSDSPLADSVPLDDAIVRQALLALTTRRAHGGRQRIAYGDLGVEQLGGVYERVLDLEPGAPPAVHGGRIERPRSELRKSTGSFYTPRALTDFLVRRALAPLVEHASAAEILSLRVLDPAMGSGAFLVAACRYLASAYEAAVLREAGRVSDDVDERERADFRRMVAQRCLFGVDINPMAVQLGRLSLWLATLAADRPLTFLDHRLRSGNSLVGATPDDLVRQPPGRGRDNRRRAASLPLLEDPSQDAAILDAMSIRNAIATEPGDTLAQVRAKEQALAEITRSNESLARWKSACDLWCSYWFQQSSGGHQRLPFGSLADSLFGRGALPAHLAAPILNEAHAIASAERFFHWVFEFPEVFLPDAAPGFDAVIGNPPWEMLRGDRGSVERRRVTRDSMSLLADFTRSSGVYSLQGDGHANLYQLFLERMLSLVRAHGRLGLILPSGLASDHGAAPLRRHLIERTAIDTFITFENRDAIFPIHRGLKFLLMTTTTADRTDALPCRFGLRQPELLDRVAERGVDEDAILLPRLLLERAGGPELTVPDVRCREDVEILTQIVFSVPALGDARGWNVRFGRELNATDDRRHFVRAAWKSKGALPVVGGKQVTPFAVDVDRAQFAIPRAAAATLLDAARTFDKPRLAYRDVASATNRLTLIAAIVPAGTVTTHTLFCAKTPLEDECTLFLCGMFNSFVANYLIRFHVGMHVTAAIISRVPMPLLARGSRDFTEIASLAARLVADPSDRAAHARLQSAAAHAYGLSSAQFHRVLATFPLVPQLERHAALALF
jgi:hypothetical protein